MGFSEIVTLLAALANFGIGFFVLLRKPSRSLYLSFALFSLITGIWCLSNFFFALSPSRVLLESQYAIGTIVIPVSLIWFLIFLDGKILKRTASLLIILAVILFVIPFINDFIIKDFTVSNSGQYDLILSNFFNIYSLVPIIFFIYLLGKNISSYLHASGIKKQQIKYILVGAAGFGGVSLFFSFILPFLKVSLVAPIDAQSSLIFVGFSLYAIIRHRLLDIKLVFTRSIIYGFSLTIVGLLFILTTFLSAQFFGGTTASRYIISFVVAILIVFGLDPLKRFLARVTDSVFYKAKIDYNLVIQEVSEGLSVEIDIDKLIENVSKSLQEKLKLKSAMIVLRRDDVGKDQGFMTRTAVHPHTPKLTIASDGALARYIEKNKISILEALERKIDDTNDEKQKLQLDKSRQELESVGAALAAPIIARGKVNALLLLGAKLSGDSFGTEDIRLIEVISPQIASAIEKAKLYEEVKSFSERLKVKVDEATRELKERNVSLLTLQRITKDITRSLDFEKIVQNIADSISTELGFLGGILVFLDDDGHTARPRAITQTTLTKRAMKLLPVSFEQLPSDLNDPKYTNMEAQVLRSGKIMMTDRIHDVVCPPLPKILADTLQKVLGVHGIVIIPIISEEKVIGVIEVGAKRTIQEISQRELDMLQSVADQLGIIYRNIKLFDQIRKANDELAEANAHLKQLDQAKSEFVSIASHQLRTPMTGIMGYLSMMTSGDFGKLKPDHLKILLNLLEESQRMIRLINLFLNVSKIEAGKFQITKTEIHLENVIEREIRELTKPAGDKGLKLVYEKPKKPLPSIMADADKIQDVLLNIIDNAIKYTAKGSVTVTTAADGGVLTVRVKDSGIGIKPQDAKELFNKFVRGPQIAQIHPDGSGLGLFIAKSIIEGHGGKIWVESPGEGKGSTFSFTIPLNGGQHVASVKI